MFQFKKLAMSLIPLMLVSAVIYANPTVMHLKHLPTPGLSLVKQATLLGPMERDTPMHVTLWLNLRNKIELDQAVRDIYDPHSPRYQTFLTADEISQRYLPSLEAEKAVKHYFEAQGIQATIVHHSVRLVARAEEVERAFHVKINHYRFKNRVVYANTTRPSLQLDIAQYVSEVTGLNNMIRFRPMLATRSVKNHANPKPHDFTLAWDSFTPDAQPTNISTINGFTGAHLTTALNLANIQPIAGTTIDGSGQTLVIIDGCGLNSTATMMNDANQYNTANGITPFTSANFNAINPDGSSFTTCSTDPSESGWEGEIALDIESSHTIAPGSNTVLVLAPNGGDVPDLVTTLNDVVSTLIPNHTIGGFSNASVVSSSWGATESGGIFNSLENSLELAVANGLSFNFSTGDCGDDVDSGGHCLNSPYPSSSTDAAVNYPASSTFVTAVGGTSLFVSNTWAYAFETGWGSYQAGFEGGGGGGISTIYGPSSWQTTISSFLAGGYTGTIGSHNTCGASHNQVCRALPDVAMLADWNTGLSIYFTGSSPNPNTYGGTSLSSPLFSGTLTLINQARALLSKSPLGLAAPYLFNQHTTLVQNQALNLVIPPHAIIAGATKPPSGAPLSAFTLDGLTYSWDSSLTIEPESQFWNDVVGVGTPNIPNFVAQVATF
ncbi:MAG: S53 family peptidase [Gammaproteobacteria bacterium]|nr:S53 family peptidase [Gammaproteobacteria bacterium]